MKIKVKDMREPLEIAILGDEAWLEQIYGSFLGKEGRGLEGSVTIVPKPYGEYSVKGALRFVPIVACSRCDMQIPWAIEKTLSVRFIDRSGEEYEDIETEEKDLAAVDLDTYYLDETGALDLELVLNDIVQTALPTRLIASTPDGKNCRICLDDISKPLSFKDPKSEESSPFAALKNLKLPDA